MCYGNFLEQGMHSVVVVMVVVVVVAAVLWKLL
jgi:hypothetical protein